MATNNTQGIFLERNTYRHNTTLSEEIGYQKLSKIDKSTFNTKLKNSVVQY